MLTKIIISIVALYSVIISDQAYAIRCFKCLVTEEVSFANEEENLPNITPACSKFDSSSKFIVECPYSTMCMKTISTMYLQYGLEQNTITRGCAPQKSSTLVFRNGNWHKEDSVKDVYVEECRLINENVLAASVKTLCYCGSDLCNSAKRLIIPLCQLTTLSILLLINN
ncbi:uncharacterized protein LOC119639212 [Glossina fuscipes]|uniref:Uncharacterized protein LOC119639212 n=1 Tax=Glossina fuscipes TaxID=7396 RepID=A0A9C6DXK8_9MUSC|nr:uncharacterized protein LOC119639212 [Glossina fuscipes]